MHCLVRGQSPSDYMIMVPAPQESLGGLEEKAEKLLQAGHKVKSAVRLTRREEEVLNGILRSLANKEIASELNLSERTVKFHVSSLLAKFKVRGRMELMRETARNPIQPMPAAVSTPAPPAQTFASRPRLYGKPMQFAEHFASGSSTLDGLIASANFCFLHERKPAGTESWRAFTFAFTNFFYLRAALYSSAALSQFTTFHHASM